MKCLPLLLVILTVLILATGCVAVESKQEYSFGPATTKPTPAWRL